MGGGACGGAGGVAAEAGDGSGLTGRRCGR